MNIFLTVVTYYGYFCLALWVYLFLSCMLSIYPWKRIPLAEAENPLESNPVKPGKEER